VKHYKTRVVERFAEYGVMDFHKTILAHCLHLSDDERSLLRGSPAWVVHNTESNQNNGVGLFSSQGMGRRVMLGTDGMHSDMLRAFKAAFFGAPKTDGLDFSGIYAQFRNVNKYIFFNEVAGDGPDNLVILDYPTPTPLTQENFLGHLIFGIESSQVRHVISNGALIVEDRKLLNVDEPEILRASQELAKLLWKKMQS
jgi:cytosine/adenosine deaminase-related metal-dependent hydrolase